VAEFETPKDLMHNRGLIHDPVAFAEESRAASWLYLYGEEFAAMKGGMSYPLDLALARRQIEALDGLPRPTLVTCRTGPRSSALIYLYAGLRTGAPAEDVLARADADDAPFARSEELRAWVVDGLAQLSR
jgi:hypothetical protein